MLQRAQTAISVLAMVVLPALPAGAKDTQGELPALDALLPSDGMTQEQMAAAGTPDSGDSPGPEICNTDTEELETSGEPGALIRGGGVGDGAGAGPFAVSANIPPSGVNSGWGFRGAR